MARTNGQRRRQVKKKVLLLARKTSSLFRPPSPLALVPNRSGQRFSLISLAEYQALLASSRAPQRESVASTQLQGFHVVCPVCDGFGVRNGRLKNCVHVADSSSSMSGGSGAVGLEASGVRICVQPPTPGSGAGVDCVRKRGVDFFAGWEERLLAPGVRKQVPASSRSGLDGGDFVANAIVKCEGPARLSPSARSDPRHLKAVTADDVSDLTHMAGEVARRRRLHVGHEGRRNSGRDGEIDGETETPVTMSNSEDLMRDWRKWSKKWEKSLVRAHLTLDEETSPETKISVDGCSGQKPGSDHESLMRTWKEWSIDWERLVKSR